MVLDWLCNWVLLFVLCGMFQVNCRHPNHVITLCRIESCLSCYIYSWDYDCVTFARSIIGVVLDVCEIRLGML